MWTALASLASLVAGIGIGWAASRLRVMDRQPQVTHDFAAPGMPFAGIVDADVVSIEHAARGSQV